GGAAGRSRTGGMRARLRRLMAAPDAHRDDAAAAPGDGSGVAPDLHRRRARARRLGLPDGTERQGDRPLDRQFLAELELGAVGGDGAAADSHRVHRRRPSLRGGALGRARHRAARRRTAMSDRTPGEMMIEVSGLQVRYGDVLAVDGVSFAVARGELLTLLGPSGCGKTTTLRAIAGLEQPCGGSIVLDGETVYSATARRNLATEKRGVSMVFQSYAIWPHMTVFENVAYGLRVRKLPRAEIDRQVERPLTLVQMTAFAGRPASRL